MASSRPPASSSASEADDSAGGGVELVRDTSTPALADAVAGAGVVARWLAEVREGEARWLAQAVAAGCGWTHGRPARGRVRPRA